MNIAKMYVNNPDNIKNEPVNSQKLDFVILSESNLNEYFPIRK